MSWSYDPTLATDLDKVRFEIQDTDTSDQLFANEEINALLAVGGGTGVLAVALTLAKKLLLKYARQVDTTVGRVSESASQRYTAMKDLVSRLEADQMLCMPSFGGTEHAKNDALDADTTLVQPWTTREGDTNKSDRGTFGGGG